MFPRTVMENPLTGRRKCCRHTFCHNSWAILFMTQVSLWTSSSFYLRHRDFFRHQDEVIQKSCVLSALCRHVVRVIWLMMWGGTQFPTMTQTFAAETQQPRLCDSEARNCRRPAIHDSELTEMVEPRLFAWTLQESLYYANCPDEWRSWLWEDPWKSLLCCDLIHVTSTSYVIVRRVRNQQIRSVCSAHLQDSSSSVLRCKLSVPCFS